MSETVTLTLADGTTTDVTVGCYVAGHAGQYGTADMVQIGASILNRDDIYDQLRADAIAAHGDDIIGTYWGDQIGGCEDASWAADEVEELLNAATPEGFVWHWSDGEFFLSPICDDDDACDDDECLCRYW